MYEYSLHPQFTEKKGYFLHKKSHFLKWNQTSNSRKSRSSKWKKGRRKNLWIWVSDHLCTYSENGNVNQTSIYNHTPCLFTTTNWFIYIHHLNYLLLMCLSSPRSSIFDTQSDQWQERTNKETLHIMWKNKYQIS